MVKGGATSAATSRIPRLLSLLDDRARALELAHELVSVAAATLAGPLPPPRRSPGGLTRIQFGAWFAW
jgi:hypothetical protein